MQQELKVRAQATLRSMLEKRGVLDQLDTGELRVEFLDVAASPPTPDHVRDAVARCVEEGGGDLAHLIFVLAPPAASAALDDVPDPVRRFADAADRPRVEVFTLSRLQFDVTACRWNPPHTLLKRGAGPAARAEADLIRRIQQRAPPGFLLASTEDLPHIFQHDPTAKYYGARAGDVFYIQRASGQTYFRLVVPGAPKLRSR